MTLAARYRRIGSTDWFLDAYGGRSLGDDMPISARPAILAYLHVLAHELAALRTIPVADPSTAARILGRLDRAQDLVREIEGIVGGETGLSSTGGQERNP